MSETENLPTREVGTGRLSTGAMVVVVTLLIAVTLACTASPSETVDVATYSGHAVPPWWVCVPSTPLPTATPQTQPADWPPSPVPTETPAPGTPSPTPTPTGWPTPTATPVPVWQPPDWPPTPQPTPTPHVITGGEFYLNQNIWIPIAAHPGTHEWLRVAVQEWSPVASPKIPEKSCIHFKLSIRSLATVPIDFDVPASLFLSSRHSTGTYFSTPQTYADFGMTYPEVRWNPDDDRTLTVPICKPNTWEGAGDEPETEHLRLGLITSQFESWSGQAGADGSPSGSDVAVWFNFWHPDPHCSYPPAMGTYPEFTDPPLGVGNPIAGVLVRQMGGRYSESGPVGIPPCLYITRGFGCDSYPTGVSGAGRCPADMPYWHTGVDFSCYEDTPVYNILDGNIIHRGWGGGYGNLVIVANETDSMRTYFAHLHSFAAPVVGCFDNNTLGDSCAAGYPVGGVGTTGMSTGNHLHWEVRLGGVPIDPFLFFGTAQDPRPSERSVLAALLSAQPVRAAGNASDRAAAMAQQIYTAYPVTFLVRDETGAPLSGIMVHLFDLDHRPLETCTTSNGRCEFSLIRGPYSVELAGTAPDGTPVDALGQANIEAQDSGQAEYLYGPLSFWHEGPGTVTGVVLVREAGFMALQPYLDATAHEDVPTPLDPRDYVPAATVQPTPIVSAGSVSDVPALDGGSEIGTRLAGWIVLVAALLFFALFFGLLWLGTQLRNHRLENRGRHA